MVYRVLGVVSLIIGGIFALVAVLVLLPFIDNFNTSLLVLCGVFGILAYVFLAIGWQLFHPPAGGRGRSREEVANARAESTAPTAEVQVAPSIAAEVPPTEVESVPAPSPVSDAGQGVEAGLEDIRTAPPVPGTSPNGSTADPAHPGPGRFKKPGAPVPHK